MIFSEAMKLKKGHTVFVAMTGEQTYECECLRDSEGWLNNESDDDR